MDLSILIPVSNHLELTRECLGSLERTIHGLRWEVIFVDDGSTDGTREFLRGLLAPRYRTIFRDRPTGQEAAAGLNAAARDARAPLLCTLSPAAVLMPGWIQPILKLERRLPRVGCVGNIHRDPISGLIDQTGILFNVDGLPAHAGHSTTKPPAVAFTRWPAVSLACCIFKASLHARLDGFDEIMPLELAGIDFCLRAAEDLGLCHYSANRSVIYVHDSGPEDEAATQPGRHRFHVRWGDRALAYQRWEKVQAATENDLFWRTAGANLADSSSHAGEPVHWDELKRMREGFWYRHWEIARERRRQLRNTITQHRKVGLRYLREHLLRPWEGELSKFHDALISITQPIPPTIPRPQYRHFHHSHRGAGKQITSDEELGHPDAFLFNPPGN